MTIFKRMAAWVLAVALMGTCALAQEADAGWNAEYDVVVIGFGAAGASAAMAAADEGASVLIVEKAPEAEAGGNSRVCHQLYATVDTAEGIEYYQSLRGAFTSTSDAVLEAYIEGMLGLNDYLISMGANPETITCWRGCGTPTYDCEYPELAGSEHFYSYSITDELANGAVYALLRENVQKRAQELDVWYESPATHLVKDETSGAITGVEVERGGETLRVRAKNGVVLACGGFENNPMMKENYLGLTKSLFFGSAYNTGDGVRMAMEVGANLWHMTIWEGGGVAGCVIPQNMTYAGLATPLPYGATILVGEDGTRFMDETSEIRHGHVNFAGTWSMTAYPETPYAIFDEAKLTMTGMTELAAAGVADGTVTKADTLAELAQAMGMADLEKTVTRYNGFCEAGEDLQYDRPAAMLIAFGEGPYYAIPCDARGIVNTQGGPERNEKAEILSTMGTPIPHLYGAGELGGVTANLYQGGGNLAECMVFGQIAGKNAAAQKEDLAGEEITLSATVYAPGEMDDLAKEKAYDVELGPNEYLGVGEGGMGGDVALKVTVEEGKITDIQVVEHHETEGISDPAFATLPGAIMEAQSTDVDACAGCTMSSTAILNAVNDALEQAK